MFQDIVIRIVLFPLSVLYGIGVSIRNALYSWGLLRSARFDVPLICIGNLTVGGSGKTPHVEYMVRWLNQYLNVATLSRGYGRKTVGFREILPYDTAITAGDEPLQYSRKFPDLPVFVSESRALAVPEIMRQRPQTQAILLDDAFQHLAISPGLNVLLTEYNRPFTRDWLIPTGRLREWRSGYRRADIIVVSKCPDELNETERKEMVAELNLYKHQTVFFSKYRYETPYDLLRPDQRIPLNRGMDILLMSAIANTDYLLDYLRDEVKSIHTLEFEDHHYFTEEDVLLISRRFRFMPQNRKVLLTTEKDAVRLEPFRDFFFENEITVLVLPIEVVFLDEDEQLFQQRVREFLLGFKV